MNGSYDYIVVHNYVSRHYGVNTGVGIYAHIVIGGSRFEVRLQEFS